MPERPRSTGKSCGTLALALEELERAPVLLLDLVGEPMKALQRPGQAGPQRELLERALACGWRGREHVQQLPREVGHALVAAL